MSILKKQLPYLNITITSNENTCFNFFPEMLRAKTIQKRVEVCQADPGQPKISRTWR